jgi:hypothetical protein
LLSDSGIPETLVSRRLTNAGLTYESPAAVRAPGRPKARPRLDWIGRVASRPNDVVAMPVHREISPK